jgi:hypothetical protein
MSKISADSNLIIVALQIGAVKIHSATVEALKKMERQGENSVHHKN